MQGTDSCFGRRHFPQSVTAPLSGLKTPNMGRCITTICNPAMTKMTSAAMIKPKSSMRFPSWDYLPSMTSKDSIVPSGNDDNGYKNHCYHHQGSLTVKRRLVRVYRLLSFFPRPSPSSIKNKPLYHSAHETKKGQIHRILQASKQDSSISSWLPPNSPGRRSWQSLQNICIMKEEKEDRALWDAAKYTDISPHPSGRRPSHPTNSQMVIELFVCHLSSP